MISELASQEEGEEGSRYHQPFLASKLRGTIVPRGCVCRRKDKGEAGPLLSFVYTFWKGSMRRVRGLAGKENVEKVGKFLQQQRKEAAKRES